MIAQSNATEAGQLEDWLGRTSVDQLKDRELAELSNLDRQVSDFLKTRATLLLRTYPSQVSGLTCIPSRVTAAVSLPVSRSGRRGEDGEGARAATGSRGEGDSAKSRCDAMTPLKGNNLSNNWLHIQDSVTHDSGWQSWSWSSSSSDEKSLSSSE